MFDRKIVKTTGDLSQGLRQNHNNFIDVKNLRLKVASRSSSLDLPKDLEFQQEILNAATLFAVKNRAIKRRLQFVPVCYKGAEGIKSILYNPTKSWLIKKAVENGQDVQQAIVSELHNQTRMRNQN